jgi:hypothetical protein
LATNSTTHITEILIALSESGVDFIVCGGVALVLQGVERLTMDIDLSVDMEEGNLKKFLAAMHRLKLKPRAPVPAEAVLDAETRKMFVEEKHALVFTFHDPDNPFRQVDLCITDPLSFNTLKNDAEVITIENQAIKVLTCSKLLELKEAIRPPRDKDLFDIQMLRKILQDTVSQK